MWHANPGRVDIALNHDTGAQVATNQLQKAFVVDLTGDPRPKRRD
ncbi:hypothetical protein [Endozoicomonas acroporae]|nr:hypothetical protein [Endozoicomonas acroporae]